MNAIHNKGTTNRQIRTRWKDVLAVTMLTLCIVVVFWWVPKTFFQQDEWYFMGKYYLFRTDPFVIFRVIGNIHFVPLQQLWFFIQYYFFGFHSVWYGVVSVGSHIVVAILAYILFRMLSFGVIPAGIGVAFFVLNPVSSQVVSWPLAATHGSTSMILMLLACIVWMKALKKQSRGMSILTGVLLFCAMLFKEDSILGYILIPVITLLFAGKRKVSYSPIIISFMVWLMMFISVLLFGPKEHGIQIHRTIAESVTYIASVPQWMGRIIMTHDSLRVVLQRFFGRFTVYFPFIDNDPLIKNVCFSMAVLFFIWFLVTAAISKVPPKKLLIFPFLIVVSLFPYIVTNSSVPESRHYFNAVFICGLWIAWYLDWIGKKKYVFATIVSSLVLLGLLIMYCVAIQPREDYLPFQKKRKSIFSAMQDIVYPSSGTVVYYIENAEALPFQSGVGDMFLVLQAQHDLSFSVYFTNSFLYRMYEEGYQKLGKKGFGYYFHIETITGDIERGLFPASAVRAYSFDKDTLRFYDSTNNLNSANMLQ